MGKDKRIYISPKEAHEISGIPEGTLANMRCQKRGPKYYKRPGVSRRKSVFYRRDEFIEWLESEPVLTMDYLKKEEK
jgi:hypothetical protein